MIHAKSKRTTLCNFKVNGKVHNLIPIKWTEVSPDDTKSLSLEMEWLVDKKTLPWERGRGT